MTLIPGIEWTHYKGHATFLGVDHPYDDSFMANTTEEVRVTLHFRPGEGGIDHPGASI